MDGHWNHFQGNTYRNSCFSLIHKKKNCRNSHLLQGFEMSLLYWLSSSVQDNGFVLQLAFLILNIFHHFVHMWMNYSGSYNLHRDIYITFYVLGVFWPIVMVWLPMNTTILSPRYNVNTRHIWMLMSSCINLLTFIRSLWLIFWSLLM